MTSTDDLSTQLSKVLTDLRRAVDASMVIRAQSKAETKSVAKVWEAFLGAFIGYIMKKGRETGQNLMADISFRNIWRR